jgi:hypothetical protein
MKHALLMALLVLATATLKAQSSIGFGFKGGATYSSFSKGQPHTGGKLGFTAGVFGNYSFSDLLGLQVEAAYFQQGGTFTRFRADDRFSGEWDYFSRNVTTSQVTLHNIEVPVLLRVNIPTQSEVKPLFFAGPSVGFNIRATENYERTGEFEAGDGLYVTATGHKDVTSEYNLYQFGATAGLGLEMPFVGEHKLTIDARYRRGLNPARKTFSYINLNGVSSSLYSDSFVFTVGFGF